MKGKNIMENNIRKITLHSREIRKDKQTFIASDAFIGGKWYKIKFTKECERAPKNKGLYELTLNFDDCSLEKGKPYTSKDGEKRLSNPTIWVKDIVKIREFSDEERKEANRLTMAEIFCYEDSDDDNHLPS